MTDTLCKAILNDRTGSGVQIGGALRFEIYHDCGRLFRTESEAGDIKRFYGSIVSEGDRVFLALRVMR